MKKCQRAAEEKRAAADRALPATKALPTRQRQAFQLLQSEAEVREPDEDHVWRAIEIPRRKGTTIEDHEANQQAEWLKMPEYDQKRLSNIVRNSVVMRLMGLIQEHRALPR